MLREAAGAKPGADDVVLINYIGYLAERRRWLAGDHFSLVGFQTQIKWGDQARVLRLIILNAPHPAIFPRTLIDDPGQRAASTSAAMVLPVPV